MTDSQRLRTLLRDLAVKTGTFTLASGKTSDFYVDARVVTLHAEGSRIVGDLVLSRLHPDVVGVGGMTLGADPITSAVTTLSTLRDRPLHGFLIRKEAKGHGTGKFVEGLVNLPKGSAVCVLEDTTTTGGSLLKAIKRAQDAGLRVVQCITVVDRQEGAVQRLADAGWALEALASRSELLDS